MTLPFWTCMYVSFSPLVPTLVKLQYFPFLSKGMFTCLVALSFPPFRRVSGLLWPLELASAWLLPAGWMSWPLEKPAAAWTYLNVWFHVHTYLRHLLHTYSVTTFYLSTLSPSVTYTYLICCHLLHICSFTTSSLFKVSPPVTYLQCDHQFPYLVHK